MDLNAVMQLPSCQNEGFQLERDLIKYYLNDKFQALSLAGHFS